MSTVHLLSLFLTENEGVINQMAVEPGENEITTALRLLENSAMDGEIITGDAIFSQKKFAQ
jgi:predicted transposase YbfD/YdcC